MTDWLRHQINNLLLKIIACIDFDGLEPPLSLSTHLSFFTFCYLLPLNFTTSQRRERGEAVVQLELAGSKQLIGKESVMDVTLNHRQPTRLGQSATQHLVILIQAGAGVT